MTGLEKIIGQIQLDSQNACSKIMANAQEQADKITRETDLQTQKQCEEIARKAQSDCEFVISRSESADKLNMRKSVLIKKQELVDKCLKIACEKMSALESDEYFEQILKLIEKYAYPQSGEIIFNKADKQRLPEDFLSKVNAKIAANGGKLELSDENGAFGAGFVLRYGEIEENCVFENLFESSAERLRDIANAMLFENVERKS